MRTTQFRIVIISLFFILFSACGSGTPANETSDFHAFTETLDETDKALLKHAGKKVVDTALDQLSFLTEGHWLTAHNAACMASGGYSLRKLDGLMVEVGADPLNYYPGISRFAGLPVNISYVFFRQADDSIVGQGYIRPQLKVSPYATNSWPLHGSLGYTYGCQGNPDKYSGYFAGGGFGGLELEFGIDAAVAFSAGLSGAAGKPADLQSLIHKGYFSGAQKLRENLFYLERAQNGKKAENEIYSFKPNQLAHVAKETRKWYFKKRNKTDPQISLGQIIDLMIRGDELKSLNSFHDTGVIAKTLNLQKELQHSFNTTNPTARALYHQHIGSQFIETFAAIEGELERLNEIVQPVFFYSRSRSADQKKLTDLRADYLVQIRKKHGPSVAKWVENGLEGYRERQHALLQIRILLTEWLQQFERGEAIDPNQTIGGIDNGPITTGCNSLTFTPEALARYMARLFMPASVAANMMNPFAVASTVLQAPTTIYTSLGRIQTTIMNIGKAVGNTYGTVSHVYQLPGTRVHWKPNATGKSLRQIQGFFDKACSFKEPLD